MKYTSETERMAHPQAKLIPLIVWVSAFESTLTDEQLRLMQMDASELIPYLEASTNPQQLKSVRQADQLAIALSHPTLSASDLIKVSQALGLSSEHEEIFTLACYSGNIKAISEVFANCSVDRVQDMVVHAGDLIEDFAVFHGAAEAGHLNVMELLVAKLTELAPEQLLDMISAEDFKAFREAAGRGHLDVMKWLVAKLTELAPEQVLDMISAEEFEAFCWAAREGRLDVMEWLMAKLTELAPEQSALYFEAFRVAAISGHQTMVNFLLQYPEVFARAETCDREYEDKYVRPFIIDKFHQLRERSMTFEQENPNNGVFDIEIDEARLLFYCIRHLIREDNPENLERIQFLLSIPAVKARVHTAVTSGEDNELFKLALRALDRDAESSMRELSRGEAVRPTQQRGLRLFDGSLPPVLDGRPDCGSKASYGRGA